MKFSINDSTWYIEEVEEKVIINKLKEQDDSTIFAAFGLCDYQQHKIWLNKNMCYDQKIQTLTHELTHCYLWSMGIRFEDYPEETICNMMYSLILFLNPIIDSWKGNKTEELLKYEINAT